MKKDDETPRLSPKLMIILPFHKTLRVQNTGDLFICSQKDWEKAKYCKWWITTEDRLINESKVFFEDYVGIRGTRRMKGHQPLDFSRETYDGI